MAVKGSHYKMSGETKLKISLARKGRPGTNKGRVFGPEFSAKLSAALKGRLSPNKGKTLPPEWRAKLSAARKLHSGPNKGKTFSDEYRAKLSAAHIGHAAWNKGTKGLMKAWNKGKPGTWMCGDKNPRWKGGITSTNRLLRESIECQEWREAIFKRDAFTCQHCGQIGGKLQADHIRIWSKHPELRFCINNGQTLCKPCHRIKTNNDLKEHWVNQYPKPVNASVSYR